MDGLEAKHSTPERIPIYVMIFLRFFSLAVSKNEAASRYKTKCIFRSLEPTGKLLICFFFLRVLVTPLHPI